MKLNNNIRKYEAPEFELVRHDDSNRVFFAASGTPSAPSVGASIGPMTSTGGSW